jgi:hypothetical protein
LFLGLENKSGVSINNKVQKMNIKVSEISENEKNISIKYTLDSARFEACFLLELPKTNKNSSIAIQVEKYK